VEDRKSKSEIYFKLLFFSSQTQETPQDVGQPNNQQPSNSSNNNPSPPATIPPSEFDCSKLAIGYYSKGCNTRYYRLLNDSSTAEYFIILVAPE
jgi:hypothetical protein